MRHHYIAIFAAAVAITAAQPSQRAHRHTRAHVARMARPDSALYAPAPVETVIVYELDGRLISEEEARQGVANGTLRWGDDGILSSSIRGPVPLPTTPPSSSSEVKAPVQTLQAITQVQQVEAQPLSSMHETSKAVEPASSVVPAPSHAPTSAPAPVSDASPDDPNDLVDEHGNCASCDKPFPNGVIPCTQFPYGYGAMPLHNEGLGGWSGIQDPVYRGSDGFDNIRTVVKDSCSDGSCCTEGTYCSYGCPNPYLKLSFPKKQGKTGQTVGGLYCNDHGMLEMADGSIGKTLCGKGSDKMTVKVQNKLKKSVSICRTDYPGKFVYSAQHLACLKHTGTESMTFPLTIAPGEIGYLANPDQGKYFFWEGKPTSAHYYVNKQGVPESEACTWGHDSKGVGNWSPTIFGTSFDDLASNVGYSSLKQNELNWNERLDYSITFIGDGVTNACKYKASTGKYGQGDQWFDIIREGCTAGISKGSTLILVLTDD